MWWNRYLPVLIGSRYIHLQMDGSSLPHWVCIATHVQATAGMAKHLWPSSWLHRTAVVLTIGSSHILMVSGWFDTACMLEYALNMLGLQQVAWCFDDWTTHPKWQVSNVNQANCDTLPRSVYTVYMYDLSIKISILGKPSTIFNPFQAPQAPATMPQFPPSLPVVEMATTKSLATSGVMKAPAAFANEKAWSKSWWFLSNEVLREGFGNFEFLIFWLFSKNVQIKHRISCNSQCIARYLTDSFLFRTTHQLGGCSEPVKTWLSTFFVSGRLEGSEMMNENPSMQATKNETPPLTCAAWLGYPRFKLLLLLLNIFLGPWLLVKVKIKLRSYTIELWPQKSYKYFDCPWSWRFGVFTTLERG